MVDLNKLKQRLEERSNGKKNKGEKFEKMSLFLKADKPGKYTFRCVAYPHVMDPDSEPYAERYYHFNIPGQYAVYCPDKNKGGKCAVCDFVWDNLKALKGSGDKKSQEEWRDKLPQLQVMVPGKLVSFVSENDEVTEFTDSTVKFLKFRSSYEKDQNGKTKMSENHKKLYDVFKTEPNWLDWKNGCNLELVYETPKEGQKTRFANVAAMLSRGGMNLARNNSQGFESKKDYDAFVESIPNLDAFDAFAEKTHEDTVKVLQRWQEMASERANKLMSESKAVKKSIESDEMVIEQALPASEKQETVVEAAPKPETPNQVKLSKLETKLKSLGLK